MWLHIAHGLLVTTWSSCHAALQGLMALPTVLNFAHVNMMITLDCRAVAGVSFLRHPAGDGDGDARAVLQQLRGLHRYVPV